MTLKGKAEVLGYRFVLTSAAIAYLAATSITPEESCTALSMRICNEGMTTS